MKEKPPTILKRGKVPLYERIRQILESARTKMARTVNTTQVVANWLIGREIVEEEQKGEKRAGYGEQLIAELSEKLTRDYGSGYSIQNLKYIRQFYLTYSRLVGNTEIGHALRSQSTEKEIKVTEIFNALRGKSNGADISDASPRKLTVRPAPLVLEIGHAVRGQSVPIKDSASNEIGHTLCGQSSPILVSIGALQEAILQKGYAMRSESWQTGQFHPNLSWTHYQTLLHVDKMEARGFYAIEAIQNNWSGRELDPAFAGVG